MPAAGPRSRDEAVTTMRVVSAGVALAGLTLTGGVAGLFARELASSGPGAAASPAAASPADAERRVVVVVHEPGGRSGRSVSAAAGPRPAAAAAPVSPVTAPAEPAQPAASSSGSDPS